MLRHKFYVFCGCWYYAMRSGPLDCLILLWRGLIHDYTKFYLSEWGPYVDYFYARNADGTVTPAIQEAFDYAWLQHQQLNRHHYQFFIVIQDDGTLKPLRMPDIDRKEMLADWKGAGRATGYPYTLKWYEENRNKIVLHDETRKWVEIELGYIEP